VSFNIQKNLCFIATRVSCLHHETGGKRVVSGYIDWLFDVVEVMMVDVV
jgi:hypothetical protein